MRISTLMLAFAMLLLLMGTSVANAQQLNWEEIGPNNTGNHTRALAVGSNGTVWAGSVGGGLWKSTDKGASWTMVSGISDNLAVSCIAIDGNRIVVGTGETYYYKPETNWGINTATASVWTQDSLGLFKNGFLRYSSQPGEGVYVSNDGGATWDHDNGTWNSSSVRYTGEFISIQEVAAKNGRSLVGTIEGLYWSDDADLTNITKSTGTSAFMNGIITDVDFANSNVVFASTKDSLYRSTDGGVTFGTGINGLFPTSSAPAPFNKLAGQRIVIAVAPSNPSIIYVTGALGSVGKCSGVFKSVDNGDNWLRIGPYESAIFAPFGNAGQYSAILGVSPADPNTCFVGGLKMYKYTDATGWTAAASHTYIPGFSTAYVPAPQLSIAFSPNGADSTFYVGGDAEIVRTTNLSRTYSFKTKGYNTAHLFGISASPSWNVLASDRFRGLSIKDNAFSSQDQQQFNPVHRASLTGGGVARYSVSHPEYIISSKAEVRGSSIQRSLTFGASYEDFYGLPLDSTIACLAPFDSLFINRKNSGSAGGEIYDFSLAPLNPFFIDEYIPADSLGNDTSILNTPVYIYVASGHYIWTCRNPFGGVDSLPTWDRVSTRLINDELASGKQRYFTAMTGSNNADHYVYVATNAGEIFRIKGAHDPLNLCITTDVQRIDGGTLPSRWITDLEVDPKNTNILIATFGGFGTGDDRVYLSLNAEGATPTFQSLTSGLEANLPVHCAVFHPERGGIVLGTEEGAYYSTADYTVGAVNWVKESNAMGNVPVTDLNYRRYFKDMIDANNYKYAPDYTLFAATHGRGAFKSTSLVHAPEGEIANSGITVKAGPNPAMSFSKISFDLPQSGTVKMEAFGIDGRPVAQLADGRFGAGTTDLVFNTKDLAAGMYLVNAVFTNSQGVYRTNLRIVVVK